MAKLRLFLAVIVLAISLTLLLWAYWPAQRETRVLNLAPAELSLPDPGE